MERNKRKKYGFLKFLILILILCGIFFYSASFPVTMKLLDNRVNGILKIINIEKDFELFNTLSEFSKNVLDNAEYLFETVKENLKENNPERKPVSAIKITCAAKFPLENNEITSDFGERKDPFSGEISSHGGIDIAAEHGSKILSAWPGRVSETGFDEIYGNYIVVEHSDGFLTKYCHLSKITANENDYVFANDKIGEVGSTGRSTGNHLHFEVIIEGRKIDPMECFDI